MIPNGTRFIGIAPGVDLKERKSAVLNKTTEPFTIEEIIAQSSIHGTQYSYVTGSGTPTENATEFLAAYEAAALLEPTQANQFTIVCGTEIIELPELFEFTADYVNVVSLTGLADVVFTNGFKVVTHRVYLRGLDGGQNVAIEMSDNTGSVTLDTVNGIDGSFCTLGSAILSGTYINCIGGVDSFIGGRANLSTYYNCTGGLGSWTDAVDVTLHNCTLLEGEFTPLERSKLYNCIDGTGKLVNFPLVQVANYDTTTHVVPFTDPETILRVLTIPADKFTNETWLSLAVSVINNIVLVTNYGGMGLYFNDALSLTGASKIGDFYSGSALAFGIGVQNQIEIDNINLLIKNDNLFCTNIGGVFTFNGNGQVGYINRLIDLTVDNYIIVTALGNTNAFPINSDIDITIESIILNKTN